MQNLEDWCQQARDAVTGAFNQLKSASSLPQQIESQMSTLLARLGDVNALIDWVAASHLKTRQIRIHGDFHLGQILVAQNDIYIIDFEGEPIKSLQHRRCKFSPLRDVAGILRSFDYAVAATIQGRPATLPQIDERRLALLQIFYTRSIAAFRNAYQEAQIKSGDAWLSSPAEETLLTMFLIKKAAYEISYELNNRPAWVAYPLEGLLNILDRLPLGSLESQNV